MKVDIDDGRKPGVSYIVLSPAPLLLPWLLTRVRETQSRHMQQSWIRSHIMHVLVRRK